LAALGQHHDRHGGELLGQRGDAEDRVGGQWDVPLDIGQSVGLAVDELAVPDHRYGRAWAAGHDFGGENRVDPVFDGILHGRPFDFQGAKTMQKSAARAALNLTISDPFSV
jgi:hypothetical protein